MYRFVYNIVYRFVYQNKQSKPTAFFGFVKKRWVFWVLYRHLSAIYIKKRTNHNTNSDTNRNT